MNSEAENERKSINLQVGTNCTIEELKDAIKNKLGFRQDAADFLGHPIDNLLMEYPTAGQFSEGINKPDLVKIASDIPRKMIKPKPARTAEEFYWVEKIDNNAFNYQLTSCGFMGRQLYLFIENPCHEKEEGKHHTLAYKIPRKTRKVFVKTTETEPFTDKSKFTLICEVETKDKVFKKDDWTLYKLIVETVWLRFHLKMVKFANFGIQKTNASKGGRNMPSLLWNLLVTLQVQLVTLLELLVETKTLYIV